MPQVDAKGQVWILSAEEATVQRLGSAGLEGKPVRLTRAEPVFPPRVRSAAMAPAGERWLLLSDSRAVLIEDGRESFLEEPSWNPSGALMVGDTPVVLVEPQPIGRWSEPPNLAQEVALALAWDGKTWRSLVSDAGLSDTERQGLKAWKLTRSAFARSSPRGRLWVANLYYYQLREYSGGGRLLTRLHLGEPEPRTKAPADVAAAEARMVAELKAAGIPSSDIPLGTMWVNNGRRVLYDVAEAADGRLYILAASDELGPEGGLVLDRFDPADLTLGRVRLPLAEEKGYQLAAGRDGLFLVSYLLEELGGFYRLSWDQLDAALWQPLDEAKVSSGAAPAND